MALASPVLLLSGGGELRRRRRAASLALLGTLLLLYAAVDVSDVGDARPAAPSDAARRALAYAAPGPGISVRASPPASDEIAGAYVVKPWVGNARDDVLELRREARLTPKRAWASSRTSDAHRADNVLDDYGTWWASASWPGDGSSSSEDGYSSSETEKVTIDLGGPTSLWKVDIEWGEEYAVDYEIEVAYADEDGNPDGSWTTVVEVSGKGDAEPTTDLLFDDDDHALQGVRCLRIRLTARAPGETRFAIHHVQVFRKKMIVGEDATGTYCGATTAAVASSLLAEHGGALVQLYENAEFFATSMTEAQKDAMFEDPCVFTVEPNYVLRARGRARKNERLGGSAPGIEGRGDEHRNLAIPEFNKIDENPANWGLERISSMGAKNGRYKWIHEGFDTRVYVFDTGIYPDHSDFIKEYDGSSRIGAGLICEGSALDYESTSHGTHVASLAAGAYHGTAKSATIHPIQVLDATGAGSTTSFLCGVERLLQDGKAFNAANAPKKMRAVVNLSLGVNGRSNLLDRAVRDMTDAGYTVVIAAGDSDDNACFYSPYDRTAITVGALSDDPSGRNDKTAGSNYGECIDVWAPGEDVVGATNAGEYESGAMSGTSVAAALASGAASLFFEDVNTDLYDSDELAATVKAKVVNKGEIGILGHVGYGSVNKVVQTTASRCTTNAHCDVGLTCLDDGQCWNVGGSPLSQLRGRYRRGS